MTKDVTPTGTITVEYTVVVPHSELGPSAADRWLACPGSVLLSRNVQDPESWWAAEGTAAHTLSEWCREQKVPASTFRGQTIIVGPHKFEVTQEMIDGVDTFVEYVEQWPGEALYEARVHYTEFVPNGFGTCDDARITDELCRVTDLKYGKGVQVFAKDNPQLKLYALGLYLTYNHIYTFDKFLLTVVQPRLNHIDQEEIDLVDLLLWAEKVVKPTASIALKPNAPIVAGDHCTFCALRRTCRVRADYVNEAVFGEMQNLDAVETALLTNAEVGLLLPKLPNIKKWCADLEAHAMAELARGRAIPHPETGDYKLVEGRSIRVWSKPEDEIANGLALEVDNPDDLYEHKLVSPAKAEKLLGKRVDISDLVFKPAGKPKLVPGTDKRPAMTIDPSAEFSALEDDDE